MPQYLDLHGHSAIDHIFARASCWLAALWDGDAHLGTMAGQRARLVLDMLGEATAKRASAGVNARGGTA
jgi:hypothetical protein